MPRRAHALGCSGSGFLRLARLDAAPLSWRLVSACRRFERPNWKSPQEKGPTDSTREATGPAVAAAPVYIPPHKMAPAPPGNESSDWLISPRLSTSLPRAPPLSGALAQSRRAGRKARSHCCWEGSGIGRQLESPRNAPSGCEARCDRRKGRGSPAGLRLLFVPLSNLAAFLLEPPPSLFKGYSFTLPLCVSVSSDRLRGLQASFLNS